LAGRTSWTWIVITNFIVTQDRVYAVVLLSGQFYTRIILTLHAARYLYEWPDREHKTDLRQTPLIHEAYVAYVDAIEL